MAAPNRPLSPHHQIYKPQLTSLLSICHRMTGVWLAVGALLLVGWLVAAASGPESFAKYQDFHGSWFGRLLLLGWTFCLFYHLCNGVRHLFWDVGIGFEMTTLNRSGILVVLGSGALTLIAWIWGYSSMGAF